MTFNCYCYKFTLKWNSLRTLVSKCLKSTDKDASVYQNEGY